MTFSVEVWCSSFILELSTYVAPAVTPAYKQKKQLSGKISVDIFRAVLQSAGKAIGTEI